MQPQKKDKNQLTKEESDIMSDIGKTTSDAGNILIIFLTSTVESAENKGFLANILRGAIEAFDNDKKYSWLIPFYQVTFPS